MDHRMARPLCDNNVESERGIGARGGREMGDLLQPWHLVVLAIVAFLLFGAKRLPELGKGLGEGLKGFREGIKGISDTTPPTPPPTQPTQQASVQPPPPPPGTEQK